MVVHLSGGCDILALCLHHIASDEATRGLLWNDISAAYSGVSLEPLVYQYSDFARLQRAEFERPAMAREVEWWRGQLAGAPQVTDLPIDHIRPAVASLRGERYRMAVDPQLVRQLRALGAEHGATLFVTMLAALTWMISRWSQSDDVVVGMPVSGRDRPETEGLVGLFVNTVVVRSDCSGVPTFGELIDRVHNSVLLALEHQTVPFDKVVEVVAPDRDPTRNPVFQILANAVTSEGPSSFTIGELTAEAVDFDPGTTKFDVGVLVAERSGNDVDLVFEYALDLFEAATVADLADEVVTLLRNAVAAPDLPIPSFSLLPPGQYSRLVESANATGAPIPAGCLHERIAAQADRTPKRPAVADENETLSYAELERRANAFAHYLRARGVGSDVLVAVGIRRSVAMEVAVLAILKAGGEYVPLDPSYPADRLGYMLEDCGAALLITETALLGSLPEHPATVLIDELARLTADFPDTCPDSGVTADNLAYVIYTSGSTGRPKGVELKHRGVVNRLDWMQRTFHLTGHDTVLQKTPLSFDVSVWEVFWPLMCGARLFMARPNGHRDVSYLRDVISREHVTVLHFVPSMLRAFLDGAPSVPTGMRTSLRAVMCSGEALAGDVKEQFFAAFPATELHNLYGPTEASVDVTWSQCRPGNASRVLIGAPISNVQVFVLDEGLRPQPVGMPGELYLAGVQLARGYLGRPDLTAEKFVDLALAPTGGPIERATWSAGRPRASSTIWGVLMIR